MNIEDIKKRLSEQDTLMWHEETAKDVYSLIDGYRQLEAYKLEAETLLQDYQDLIKCDYGKNNSKFDNKGLYMQDLAEAIGENASKECERIYLKTEEFFRREK